METKSLSNTDDFKLVPWAIALVIVGAILKVCGVIGWGWAIITAPLWLPFAAIFVVACIFIGFAFSIACTIAGVEYYYRRRYGRSCVLVRTKHWCGRERWKDVDKKGENDGTVNAG